MDPAAGGGGLQSGGLGGHRHTRGFQHPRCIPLEWIVEAAASTAANAGVADSSIV